MREDSFLASLFTRLGAVPEKLVVPPGDDCAALAWGSEQLLLLAIDQVVGDRHYLREGPEAATPASIGRKLLGRNLSDIAAMGGRPLYCLVSAAAGPGRSEQWLNDVFGGIIDLGSQFGVSMIGGDLATAPSDEIMSLAILGEVAAGQVCRRGGAAPGQTVCATGCFGASFRSGHHLAFTPRCREGAWLAEHRFATAMIDVSDGLVLDLARLCRASEVRAVIDPERIPPRTGDCTTSQVLTDGEDYELLFTVTAENRDRLERLWPFPDVPVTAIGHTVPRHPDSPTVTLNDGSPATDGIGGYDHFAE